MASLLLRIRFTGYVSEDIVEDVANDLRGDGIRCYIGGERDRDGEPMFSMSVKADRPLIELVELTLNATPVDAFVDFHLAVRERGKTLDGCPVFFGQQPGRADFHEVA